MKSIIFFPLLVLISTIVFSQEIKTYSGSYCELCDRNEFKPSKTTYNYYENNNSQRIFHGNFKYSVFESISFYHSYLIEINGQYNNNLANGSWNYKKKVYNPDNKPLFMTINGKKIQYSFPQTIGQGSFENGYRTGNWTIIKSNKGKILENCIANFDKTKFQSNFLFETEEFSVKGNFNESGLMNNEWLVLWKDDETQFKSSLIFRNGILTQCLTKNITNGEIVKQSDNSDFITKFYDNIDESELFSVIDGKNYILEDKRHKIDYVTKDLYFFEDEVPLSYSEDDKEIIGLKYLYMSLNFWILPLISGSEYNNNSIISEIRRGIEKIEYITEKKIVAISEDDLIITANRLNINNLYIENIKSRKIAEQKKIIEEQDRIKAAKEDENRKTNELKANKEKLVLNFDKIFMNNSKIQNIYHNEKIQKKSLYNAFIILKSYYSDIHDVPNNVSVYSKEKLDKSIEYLLTQENIISFFYTDIKPLEKQIKNTDNPEKIIELINSYKK